MIAMIDLVLLHFALCFTWSLDLGITDELVAHWYRASAHSYM